MPGQPPSPREPAHVGQLLVQLTRLFQSELHARLVGAGIEGARTPHTHVTAFIAPAGSRLTELAARARVSRPAMAELVDDLQRLGVVERRPDPSDRRAKLIVLTDQGRDAVRAGDAIIAGLEAEYAGIVGAEEFDGLCAVLQQLVDRHPSRGAAPRAEP